MAMQIKEVRRWLDTVADDHEVAIADDGICLVEIDAQGVETGAYVEIGGVPLKDDTAG